MVGEKILIHAQGSFSSVFKVLFKGSLLAITVPNKIAVRLFNTKENYG